MRTRTARQIAVAPSHRICGIFKWTIKNDLLNIQKHKFHLRINSSLVRSRFPFDADKSIGMKWNQIESALVPPEMSHLRHSNILSVDVQGFRRSLDDPKNEPVQHSVGINALVSTFFSSHNYFSVRRCSCLESANDPKRKMLPRLKLTSRSRQKHLIFFTLNWKSNDLKLLFYIRREFHASRRRSESPGGENIKSLEVLWYRRRFFGSNFRDDVLMSRSFGRFSRLTTELLIKSLRRQKAKRAAKTRPLVLRSARQEVVSLSLSSSLFFFRRKKIIISIINSTKPFQFQETVHSCWQLFHRKWKCVKLNWKRLTLAMRCLTLIKRIQF